MDWFSSSSSRPVKTLDFYQHKLLRFLFSAEGKDDFRCLNIPVSQLGFYSPVHFLSCIPSQLCEPYRNDKLFLATNGEIRKGDRVLLVQESDEGTAVQSAVFKARRIGKSGEPEIILDGHKKTYTENQVVPYKAYLREQLGTALIPEENFVISDDGILDWEEPTWEPGQEIYYKPENRWAVFLSDELSPRGRIIVNLKLEQTNFKKEKIVKMSLDDLKANAVPLRIPLKKQRRANSVDDLIQRVNEEFKEIYQVDQDNKERDEHEERDREKKSRSSEKQEKHVTYDDEEVISSSASGVSQVGKSNSNGYAVVMKKDKEQMKENEYATMTKKKEEDAVAVASQPVLRPKRSKRPKERPQTEYIPTTSTSDLNYVEIQQFQKNHQQQQQQQPPLPERNKVKREVKHVEETPKFKSCNNLASSQYSDDDLEPFELVNYTNSLRSSARKIIQRQMAEGSGNKSASLKLRHAASSKPHVTEVFSWNDEMGRMSRRSSETTAITQKRKETHLDEPPPMAPQRQRQRHAPVPMISTSRVMTPNPDRSRMTSPVPPLIRHTPSPSPSLTSPNSNNLNKSLSQPDIRRDVIDSAKKPSATATAAMAHAHTSVSHPPPKPPMKSKSQSQNPLDYEFAPLSSSELVKKQLAIVNRVLHEPQFKGGVLYQDYILPKDKNGKRYPPDDSSIKVHTGASSDSSSHDNDSGRGSYQFLPENVKGMDELVGVDHVMSSPQKKYVSVTPIPPVEQESVYANENMTIYSQNGNHNHNQSMTEDSNQNGHNYTQRESSPTRRYIKNRSNSRNTTHRYNGAIEGNESEEEYTLPLPFNPGHLGPVAGYGRGIQGTENSSFADATLYALFACSNIFDKPLLFSQPGLVEKGIKRDVRRILRDKIVVPLRTNAYCKSENITHLREAMLPLSSKMHSSLMDAEEFLYLLFDSALNTDHFIEFSNGTKDFMHQIIARPKDRSKSQTIQYMLETSLAASNLKFMNIPEPALLLSSPRCRGKLVYFEAIVPSLQLNMTRLLHKGPKQCVCEMAATLECMICHQKNGDLALDFCQTCKDIADQVHFRLGHDPVLVPKRQRDEILNLHSIICTRGNRYVSFVKVSEQKFSPWLFFDPMAGDYPEVTLLEDFGKWLDSLEKQPGHYREFAKLHPLLKRIMTDSHIYIYSKTHMIKGTEHKESMRI